MKLLYWRSFCVYILINFACLVSAVDDNCYAEKSMVIVIPSYNNQQWYERNVQSVLSQNYTNFRIIYCDDCSPDGTGKLVQEYLVDNDPNNKVCLIKNTTRRGPLHNMYTMVHMCEDDEIVVTLDGDDWFSDSNVLSKLNAIYSSGEIWMTYGQFQSSSSGACGWAMPMSDDMIKSNAFRGWREIPTHLRTFYAWLFKKIKLQDLLYMGKFYPMAGDTAFMFPIIEMAGERHQFIADIMYIYNDENTINEHKRSRQLQVYLATTIVHKERYKRLVEKPAQKNKNNVIQSDAIVFAQSPEKLALVLESLKTYVDGIEHIFVMCKPELLQEKIEYNTIRTLYPNVELYLINPKSSNFSDILFSIYLRTCNNYILFSKGDTVFQKPLSLSECINALEDASAYAFYFNLNAQEGMRSYQSIPLLECNKNVYAWNFAVAIDQWSSANSLDCVLHKKDSIISFILNDDYDPTPHGIEYVWANEGQLDRLGLCFGESHVAALT